MAMIRPHGLIAPLKFHDGEHFPQEAKDVEWQDVSAYAATLPIFWNSVRAIELDDILKAFAGSVAAIIQSAPAFRSDWPVINNPGVPIPKIGLAKL